MFFGSFNSDNVVYSIIVVNSSLFSEEGSMRRMTTLEHRTLILILLICAAVSAPAQQSPPSISVTGSIAQPFTLTAADLAQMPRASVTMSNGGVETRYE